ncbi:hypothetical protein AB4Z33_30605 [Paenibacillus sp. 2TAB19]
MVARNIRDLLSLYLCLRDFYVLVGFSWYESKEDFIRDYNDNFKDDIEEQGENINFISNKLTQLLDIKPIEDPFLYIHSIRRNSV